MIGRSCSKSSSTWNKLQEMIVGKGRLSIYIYNFKNNPFYIGLLLGIVNKLIYRMPNLKL